MSAYYALGGFDPIEIIHTGTSNYAVAGLWLRGDISKKDERELFYEMQSVVASGKVEGDLCIVDYQDDTLAIGEMNRFIGVLLRNEISAIPAGFDVLEVTSSDSFMAALTMHPLVMPNTEAVETMLIDSAYSHEIKLRKMTFEIFYPDNSVIVQMFSTE